MTAVAYTADTFALETQRLRLRPLARGDDALFRAIYMDPATMRLVCPALTHPQAQELFQSLLRSSAKANPACAFLVIESRRTGAAIGICAAPQIDLPERSVEVGMMLLDDVDDRHLGAAAMTALIGRLFEVLPVDEVWVKQPLGHRAASRIAAGIGFKPDVGGAQKRTDPGMKFASILRQEWDSGRARSDADPSIRRDRSAAARPVG